jgi:hypothetical protein
MYLICYAATHLATTLAHSMASQMNITPTDLATTFTQDCTLPDSTLKSTSGRNKMTLQTTLHRRSNSCRTAVLLTRTHVRILSTPSDQDAPITNGPVRGKRSAIPRSERRKHYKPKPDPSDPRLFRPFAPNEAKNTMLAQWTTPPIIGSYVMFPNKKLKYNPVPPDLDQVREKLFKMEDSVLLKNSQELADYLPHVTNFWRRVVQKQEVDPGTGLQYEYWYCRSKKSRKPAESVSKGIRNKAGKRVVLHGRSSVSRFHVVVC